MDGSPPVDLGVSSNDIMDAAWSPDGSKIAIRTNREFPDSRGEASKDLVYIVERDGTNLRTLVEAVKPIQEEKIRLVQ